MRMRSHPGGLDVWVLVESFVDFHTSYVRIVKSLATLRGCAGSPKPSLVACAIKVTGYFVPRSFRTQVISYHFGHFVPTFLFSLVISYPVWSFRTHFVPSLVISYLLSLFIRKPFWSFRIYFLLFRTKVISYPKSFSTHFSQFVPRWPGSFRAHFQTSYELT